MSIIIGIICNGGIVVASDSQVSFGNTKRMDAEKIRTVRFKNSDSRLVGCGLIANSGDIVYSQRAVEITCELCLEQDFTDGRQIAENAAKASLRLQREMKEPYVGIGGKPEDFHNLFAQNTYSLLMASMTHGPSLYVLDFPGGLGCKQNNYVAIGCGANLATFLLSWFNFHSMDVSETSITAAFIINEVKKNDAFCGGRTQISYVTFDGQVMSYIPAIMDATEKQIEYFSQDFKKKWSATVIEISDEVLKQTPEIIARLNLDVK